MEITRDMKLRNDQRGANVQFSNDNEYTAFCTRSQNGAACIFVGWMIEACLHQLTSPNNTRVMSYTNTQLYCWPLDTDRDIIIPVPMPNQIDLFRHFPSPVTIISINQSFRSIGTSPFPNSCSVNARATRIGDLPVSCLYRAKK